MEVVISFVFRAYRLILSPLVQAAFDVRCRYDETCSRYAEKAIRERGVLRGALLAMRRIISCNGWSKNG